MLRISPFYALGTGVIVVFLLGCWRHIAKYRRGAPVPVHVDLRRGAVLWVGAVRSCPEATRPLGWCCPCRHFLRLYAGRDWYNHHIDYGIFEPLFGFSLTKVAGAVLCCRFLVVR